MTVPIFTNNLSKHIEKRSKLDNKLKKFLLKNCLKSFHLQNRKLTSDKQDFFIIKLN